MADEADELDLNGVFARWYFQTITLAMPKDWRPEPESGEVNYIITASARRYWVEYDRTTEMARTAIPTFDTARLIAVLEDAVGSQPGRYTFEQKISTEPAGEWLPTYRLIPGAAVMRDPSNWQEPPD